MGTQPILFGTEFGYLTWELFNTIVAKGSSYASRARDNLNYETLETRELSLADQQAGVLKDEIIQ